MYQPAIRKALKEVKTISRLLALVVFPEYKWDERCMAIPMGPDLDTDYQAWCRYGIKELLQEGGITNVTITSGTFGNYDNIVLIIISPKGNESNGASVNEDGELKFS